ncbi:MAG: hypothetical protein J6J21_04045 [Clostridia bacterium]|nr:hypothetical protein [Clostridia bacterium]
MKRILIVLMAFLLLSMVLIQPVCAGSQTAAEYYESFSIPAGRIQGLGTFSEYRKSQGVLSNTTSGAFCDEGELYFYNSAYFPSSTDNTPVPGGYHYVRKEVYAQKGTLAPSHFTIQFRLKLNMPSLRTPGNTHGYSLLSAAKTGFIVNVRSTYANREVYLSISASGNGISVSSFTGNREELDEYTTKSIPNVDPSEYHQYFICYNPGNSETDSFGRKLTLMFYVDGEHKASFPDPTTRSIQTGYYGKDYVGLTLCNRSENAQNRESANYCRAISTAYLSEFNIFNDSLETSLMEWNIVKNSRINIQYAGSRFWKNFKKQQNVGTTLHTMPQLYGPPRQWVQEKIHWIA